MTTTTDADYESRRDAAIWDLTKTCEEVEEAIVGMTEEVRQQELAALRERIHKLRFNQGDAALGIPPLA